MAHRILTLALAAGTAIGIATLAHAQGGVGGSPSSPGAAGYTYQPPMMNEQRGTVGQGRGASDVAPGRSANPPPGQGGEPPGQMMNEQKRPRGGNR
ncbi:MAG: hypothetical protein GEU95_00370 [Rhizobiales bacterium]|nr:hypothetical protein [Hyphomicrobiales bacterium]